MATINTAMIIRDKLQAAANSLHQNNCVPLMVIGYELNKQELMLICTDRNLTDDYIINMFRQVIDKMEKGKGSIVIANT